MGDNMLRFSLIMLAATSLATFATAQDTTVSVDVGERLSIIGGCHDCHTVGYNESGGQIDPETALKGSPLGYSGPWGTTYAANLRLVVSEMTEDEFVEYLATIETRPPMPWFNLHVLREDESRSLYQYIAALGEPGDPAPEYVPPDGTPQQPFIVMVPGG